MAGKGLSLFAVLELVEDLIDKMDRQVELLQAATSATEKELQYVLTVKPVMDAHFSNFMLHLKQYTNLCYSLFGNASIGKNQYFSMCQSIHHVDFTAPSLSPGSMKYHSTHGIQDNVGNTPDKEHCCIPCQGPHCTHPSGTEKMPLGNRPRKSAGRWHKEEEDV
eukprot:7716481-Ditylum_brightwellii.AAC.2